MSTHKMVTRSKKGSSTKKKNIPPSQEFDEDDIDIILITEPRKTSESSAFTHIDVKNYLNLIMNEFFSYFFNSLGDI